MSLTTTAMYNPSAEYKPTSIFPVAKIDDITTIKSATPINFGTLTDGNHLFKISPIKSVPPVVPFILKIIPSPSPNITPPVNVDNNTSLVISKVLKFSHTFNANVKNIIPNKVFRHSPFT